MAAREALQATAGISTWIVESYSKFLLRFLREEVCVWGILMTSYRLPIVCKACICA